MSNKKKLYNSCIAKTIQGYGTELKNSYETTDLNETWT